MLGPLEDPGYIGVGQPRYEAEEEDQALLGVDVTRHRFDLFIIERNLPTVRTCPQNAQRQRWHRIAGAVVAEIRTHQGEFHDAGQGEIGGSADW